MGCPSRPCAKAVPSRRERTMCPSAAKAVRRGTSPARLLRRSPARVQKLRALHVRTVDTDAPLPSWASWPRGVSSLGRPQPLAPTARERLAGGTIVLLRVAQRFDRIEPRRAARGAGYKPLMKEPCQIRRRGGVFSELR